MKNEHCRQLKITEKGSWNKDKHNTCKNTEIWEVTLTSESVSNNKNLGRWQWLSKYIICAFQEY